MKFGIFTDSHYCPADVYCKTRRPRLSLGKVQQAMEAFVREGVEAVLCLGDMTDRCDSDEIARGCLNELLDLIRSYGLPFYLVPGNHDYKSFSRADWARLEGVRTAPCTVDTDRARLILLDGCYRSDMRCYDEAGEEWTDANLPPEQMAFLRRSLGESGKSCTVIIHQQLDPDFPVKPCMIRNSEEVRLILQESGKVSLVLQGHHHEGFDQTRDGIRYLTLPAMCEGEENRYFIMDL